MKDQAKNNNFSQFFPLKPSNIEDFYKLYLKGLKLGAFRLQFQIIQMINSELDRIRLLENRMRNKSRNQTVNNNQQSIKSIKSTDSKKAHHGYKQQKIEAKIQQHHHISQSSSEPFNILSEDQIKRNKKITDYFTFKQIQQKKQEEPQPQQEAELQASQQARIKSSQIGRQDQQQMNQQNKSDQKPEQSVQDLQDQNDLQDTHSNQKNKYFDKAQHDSIKQQNSLLKQKLKVKQEMLAGCKQQMLQYVIKCHKMKRNQLRQRVSNNKIRLGEYIPDKKGKDIWIDGIEIRQIKQKIQAINREKQELEKLKKQSKKTNKQYQQDPQEWKNSIASQTYFLTRQQTHYQQILKRLDEEKMLHIKQYKLLFEQEHSKYGKINPDTGVPNWIRIKKYQLLGLLGKGGFSQVYKAFDVEQMRQVACKIHQFHSNWNSSAKENYIKHALRENAVHKALFHPNIVKLYDTVQIDNNSFCTVLQYCEGPDLSYYLKKHKKIPEKQAKMIIKQVINAIRYLHSLQDKVIHYDLKPQNIMFHKGKIKITDFGLCKTTKEDVIQLTSQGVGTYWYLPPECFQTSKKAVITPKVDIWSIGVVYFEMLFGQKPFGDKMSQLRILNEGIMLKATTVNFPNSQKNNVTVQRMLKGQCRRQNRYLDSSQSQIILKEMSPSYKAQI